jgi:predicted nuclease with TOPRIM domain
LDSLYLGNLNLNENLSSSDPKFHELQKQACELEDQVESKLNLLDKDLFHAMLHNLSSGLYRLRYAA